MNASEVGFLAEGSLQLGPGHCARLDMQVHTGTVGSRLLVVSDGHALARITRYAGEAPIIAGQLLVPSPADSIAALVAPDQLLRDNGCGGPYPLVTQLRDKLTKLSTQTGTWNGRTVARLHGTCAAGGSADLTSTLVPEFCYVYVDAQSLWPHRIEWWGKDQAPMARPVLEIEFRDPQLNRPLSMPDCIRAFSYQPSESGT